MLPTILLTAALLIGQVTDPGRHWVTFEGMVIQVEGHVTERGTISWRPELEFNRQAVACARAQKAAPLAPEAPHVVGEIPNYGLSPEKMGLHAVRRSAEATRFIEEAHSEGPVAPAGKIHLTVIGADQDREQLLKDLRSHPAFASLKDRLMVQAYRPDQWAVDPRHGFQVGGKPSIIAQQAKGPGDPRGGRVIYRALDYTMGPEVLATALSAEVRKIDPTYNPARDPGPAASQAGGLPFGMTPEDAAVGAVVAVGLLFLVRLPRKDG